jgi:hypothetical protein
MATAKSRHSRNGRVASPLDDVFRGQSLDQAIKAVSAAYQHLPPAQMRRCVVRIVKHRVLTQLRHAPLAGVGR